MEAFEQLISTASYLIKADCTSDFGFEQAFNYGQGYPALGCSLLLLAKAPVDIALQTVMEKFVQFLWLLVFLGRILNPVFESYLSSAFSLERALIWQGYILLPTQAVTGSSPVESPPSVPGDTGHTGSDAAQATQAQDGEDAYVNAIRNNSAFRELLRVAVETECDWLTSKILKVLDSLANSNVLNAR